MRRERCEKCRDRIEKDSEANAVEGRSFGVREEGSGG